MLVLCSNGFAKKYSISTAKKGIGNISGSYQTPIGQHSICEKLGDGVPLYTIFKFRENTGTICNQINIESTTDLILTRILRLKGEEPGINAGIATDGTCVDSYQRYIYIHGTNREDLLKNPASYGCIRMANADIAELFTNIQVGAVVDIRPALY
jgi:hypothetical protein